MEKDRRNNYNRGSGGDARGRSGDGGRSNRGGRGGNYHHQSQNQGGGGSANLAQPSRPFTSSRRVPEQTLPDVQSLEISEKKPPLSLPENRIVPIGRPDEGGTLGNMIELVANHFLVGFNPESIIMHYDVDIKPNMPPGSQFANKPISKSDLRLIMKKVSSDYPTQFPEKMFVYDGERNIFSAVPLPTGIFMVELSSGESTASRSYKFTIQLVNELKFSKLIAYLSGRLSDIPRDIMQGMDLVMKENPYKHMISVGRSFYSKEFRAGDDLGGGVAAFRGFKQSLKLTSQGLALCLDFSVLPFLKQLPVIDFLKEHVWGFEEVDDVRRLRREVTRALKGLKVTVTHRVTKKKYTIAGLTNQNARDITFPLEDLEGVDPPREMGLVEYFRMRYNKEIMFQDIPCLELGRSNYVPMEFCILVEGQRYPKEQLDKERGRLLKELSLPQPWERKNTIDEMVRSEDGPCGDVARNFEIKVEKNMTRVSGRVIEPPNLKLGTPTGNVNVLRITNRDKCQWNLLGRSVVVGKPLEQWALIDFSSFDCNNRLDPDLFIPNLINRCRNMGIRVEEPLVCRLTSMRELSSIDSVRGLLESVVKEANRECKGLQIIVCVMSRKHEGYKYLKWVSETQIGVLTQCCLVGNANKGQDQFLANLALKINAKIGGSNFELHEPLPGFEGEEHIMFVGADVNHPAAMNATCPSIAAVVATINWPAANRYAARVCPQEHRKEKILNFGSMCLDLVNTYARLNKVKPKKIVVFRDGVSEGQFDMVLNEELLDLKRAIYEENYRPTITLVVAQKRHLTRSFLENEREGGAPSNVPPGTVVDTIIVHPFEFDFYLYSHYGSIGTSRPTHYHVLWDEHEFTSDQIQKLIYNLCFTFARCTKPVSLVTPVYYADLVAYRGRLFQEVVMEFQSPPSVSSSSSGPSSSSSLSSAAASFDEGFYKLYSDLQDIMFFI